MRRNETHFRDFLSLGRETFEAYCARIEKVKSAFDFTALKIPRPGDVFDKLVVHFEGPGSVVVFLRIRRKRALCSLKEILTQSSTCVVT